MSKEKFEKLIEYVINDDEAKAKELFHQIVVEKSRQIYEEMMTEEEDEDLEEAKDEDAEELDEDEDEDLEEDAEELDEDENEDLEEGSMDGDDAMGRMDMDEMGGDAANQLISDVEMDEAGMVEDEDMDAVGDLEDRVANLEDEVDELIAAFDALVDGDDADMDDMDADMDDMDADAEEMDADAEGDAEMVDDTSKMTEGVSLKPAPQPVKSEEGGINKKPVVAANAGGKGPIGNSVKPVHPTGTEAHGRPAPGHKDLISDVQNKVGGNAKLKPANKPVTAQASGVNTKSVTH